MPAQEGVFTIHRVETKNEIDLLFMAEARYGIANITLKNFLLCDYAIADSDNFRVLRDRDWIVQLDSLEDYCFVPNYVRDEIPIIKKYLTRKKIVK